MWFEAAEPAHPVLDLRDDLGLTVELVDAEVLAKLIHDGQEGAGLTERDAAALEEPTLEFEQEARLPDACLAGDEHDLPPALADAIEELHERGDLPVSPDEGREAALTLDVQPCLAASGPQDLERLDRHVTFHRQLAQGDRFEIPGDQPMRRGANQHAARSRVLLQARGHVGRVADRRVVHAEMVADLADDDRAGVEADSHLEAPAQARRQT